MYLFILYLHTVFIIDDRKILESPIVITLNKSVPQDFMSDESIKLSFDHLFSGRYYMFLIGI